MKVRIETGSRLHLGFYNFLSGRNAYGSIGIAIDRPRVVVEISYSERPFVENRTRISIERDALKVMEVLNINAWIRVLDAIPRHVGLGSTTQLRLAMGVGIMKIKRLRDRDSRDISISEIYDLAAKLELGFVSGIGVATFCYGGFIVDTGRRVSGSRLELPRNGLEIPKPMIRLSVPDTWKFIVVIPRKSRSDYAIETIERDIMSRPRPVSDDTRLRLYELTFHELVPSIIRDDIEAFGRALTEIQLITGRYFAEYQGGEFISTSQPVIEIFRKCSVYGYGQSSWGPAVYALVDSDSVDRVYRCVEEGLKMSSVEIDRIVIASPRNSNAKTSILE